MSVLGKKPYLEQALSGLTGENLATLRNSMNGEGARVSRSLVNSNNLLSNSDKFKTVDLELSSGKGTITGYFLGNYFIQIFKNRDNITLWNINLSRRTCSMIDEPATATDLRRIVDDLIGAENELSIGDVINLGTLDRSGTPVEFVKSLTEEEASTIPQQGLAIIMFNTTCIILPYVLGQWDRFVANCIYNDDGDSMVVRGRLNINTAESPYVVVVFDNEYSTAVQQLTESPYGVIRFIGL